MQLLKSRDTMQKKKKEEKKATHFRQIKMTRKLIYTNYHNVLCWIGGNDQ